MKIAKHGGVNVRRRAIGFAGGRLPRSAAALAAALVAVLAALLAVQAGVPAVAAEAGPSPKAERVKKAADAERPAKKKDPYAWKRMFDGRSLKGWKVPVFGGDGEVEVKDGAIVLGMGDPMTGITWSGKELPVGTTENYEVQFEACRTRGIDFFATTTFPVGKDYVSFVTGGWAGTVVGISCVDYYDASDNITTRFKSFEDKEWYKIRIRVSEPKIECWIYDPDDDAKDEKDDDDEEDVKCVDLVRKGHKFDTRIEVDLCKPFGFASYMTEGRIRNVRIRRLKPEEVAKIKEVVKKEERAY